MSERLPGLRAWRLREYQAGGPDPVSCAGNRPNGCSNTQSTPQRQSPQQAEWAHESNPRIRRASDGQTPLPESRETADGVLMCGPWE